MGEIKSYLKGQDVFCIEDRRLKPTNEFVKKKQNKKTTNQQQNNTNFRPQSLLKTIPIAFKGYIIDLSSWQIAVPVLIGNTGGFACLFAIDYRFKHNL